jgi:hypothetical protein
MDTLYKFVIFGLVLLFIGPSRSPICSLVDDYIVMDLSNESDRYNNGYKEERYNYVLDQFLDEFRPDVAKGKGSLFILRDWSDGAVNAWAWRIGKEYWLEIPGGMARFYLIKESGFLSTLCHELGHLLGGTPHNNSISYEGQADYYSSMKCMGRMLKRLGYQEKIDGTIECEGGFCNDRYAGILSLTSYYAELEKGPIPSLKTPSTDIANQTLSRHPLAQCRFDTMIASLKCANNDSFSYVDVFQGACGGIGARPLCWFNPEEFLVHN